MKIINNDISLVYSRQIEKSSSDRGEITYVFER